MDSEGGGEEGNYGYRRTGKGRGEGRGMERERDERKETGGG